MSLLTLNLCLLSTSWCMDRYDLCFQDQRLSFCLTEKGCYNLFFSPLRKWKKIVILKKIPYFFQTGRLYAFSPSILTFPRSEKCPTKLLKLFQVSPGMNFVHMSSAQMISCFIFLINTIQHEQVVFFIWLFACAITFCLLLYREKTCWKLVFCLDFSEKAVF